MNAQPENPIASVPAGEELAGFRDAAMVFLGNSKVVKIETDADHTKVCGWLQEGANFEKRVRDRFKTGKSLANTLHKWIVGLENEVLTPAISAGLVWRQAVGTYRAKQEQERRRLEAELSEKLAHDRNDAAQAEALALEAAGDSAGADAVIEEALCTAHPIVSLPEVKVPGVGSRKAWKYTLRDLSQVKAEYLMLDEAKAGKIVRALGKEAEKVVGGISVEEEELVVVRARA